MFHVEPFKPEDYFQVEGKEIKVNPIEHGQIAQEFYRRGLAFTVYEGEKQIACGGIAALNVGIGLVWLNTSARATQKFVWFHKTIILKLKEVSREMQLERLITEADEFNTVARKWLKRLGFTEDGPTTHFAQNGNRLIRYSRGRYETH